MLLISDIRKGHQMKARLFIISVMTLFAAGCSVSSDISKYPRNRNYSKSEWLEIITHPEHQTRVRWKGGSPGYITKNGGGSSGGVLNLEKTPEYLLERKCFQDGLLKKDPLMFLPALASENQRVVLTGLYIYGYFRLNDFSDEQRQEIAKAFRRLFKHPDTPIRARVYTILIMQRLLTADDLAIGLSDPASDVRYIVTSGLDTVFEDYPVYTMDGKLHKGSVEMANKMYEDKLKLVPVLLEHFNEPNPHTRSVITGGFFRLFARKQFDGTRVKSVYMDGAPTYIHRMKASWHEYERTKKTWTKWWNEHGEEALKFAHPSQK
jgi:hypothetical protein